MSQREMHLGTPIAQRKSLLTQQQPSVQRQPRQGEIEDDLPDEVWPPRLPTSARRYQGLQAYTEQPQVITQGKRKYILHQGPAPTRQPPRQASPRHREEEDGSAPKAALRLHWLVFVGLAMLVMITGWIFFSWLANWWQVTQDDWHYGRPRTFQIDQRVGHDDDQTPSHFIAINLNRHVEIIECPGGDCSKAVIYLGPTLFGDGEDLTPVTLSFKDVNGDGKLDMLVHIQDQTFAFLNENGKFRPARPDEHLSL